MERNGSAVVIIVCPQEPSTHTLYAAFMTIHFVMSGYLLCDVQSDGTTIFLYHRVVQLWGL